MGESTQHIFAGDWYDNVNYWRPAGILQCLPIFSMALFCQTQLFEIYETIPNVSLEKMNDVVRGALNICTVVYMCVGLFGYIAFCTQSFTGNLIQSRYACRTCNKQLQLSRTCRSAVVLFFISILITATAIILLPHINISFSHCREYLAEFRA